jgi:hypothetical protein
MSITITLPADIEKSLQAIAEAQQVSVDELRDFSTSFRNDISPTPQK